MNVIAARLQVSRIDQPFDCRMLPFSWKQKSLFEIPV